MGELSVWGDTFRARIDFDRAIRDADRLDKSTERIYSRINGFNQRALAQVNSLTAAYNRLYGAASKFGSLPGMLPGGIAGAAGGALPPSSSGMAAAAIVASMTGRNFNPGAQSYSGAQARAREAGQRRVNRALPSGVIDVPFRDLGPQRALPPGGYPLSNGPRALPPGGAPPTIIPPGGFPPGSGGPRALPPGGSPPGGGYRSNANVVGRVRQYTSGYSGFVNGANRNLSFMRPNNLYRAAAGLYVGQMLGSLGTFVGRQTIGQAMNLDAGEELLENALMNERIGIGRDDSERMAKNLTRSRYMGGMDTSVAKLGLSRVDLAEQYRTLAPIVRLTAKNQDEFQAGLQRGSLAKQLLVARDPVQGNRGAGVALSELYSGGPDRFRSLAMRFELPRNRLKEIEAEMGGQGKADPGRVVVQMLEEMGFGLEYLERKSKTLAGQLERTGALMANFKVDLFGESMLNVEDKLTRFNDAFETFMASPAADKVIGRYEKAFGVVTNAIVNPLENAAASSLRLTGPQDARAMASDMVDYIQTENGSYVDVEGKVISAAEAFYQAAEIMTKARIEVLNNAPVHNPGEAIARESALWSLGIVGGGALVDKFLAKGNIARAIGFASQGNIRGGITAGRAAGAAMLPGAVALGGAALAGAGYASFRNSDEAMEQLRAMQADPEFYRDSFSRAERIRLGGANRLSMTIGGVEDMKNSLINSLLGEGATDTLAGKILTFSPLDVLGTSQENLSGPAREKMLGDSLSQSAAMMRAQGLTEAQIDANLRGMTAGMREANPDSFLSDAVTERKVIDRALGAPGAGALDLMAQTVLESATRRGKKLDLGTGKLVDAGAVLSEGREATFMRDLLGVSGGDQQAAMGLLVSMLENLSKIEENTEKTAEEVSVYQRIRPSSTDLFSGYDANPDARFVRRSNREGRVKFGQLRNEYGPHALPRGYTPFDYSEPTSLPRMMRGSGASGSMGELDNLAAVGANPAFNPLNLSPLDLVKGQHYGEYYDGIITDTYMSDRGNGKKHGGVDYVVSDRQGAVRAPSDGQVSYLRSQADYDASPYKSFFPGGFDTYGNTALFTDATGAVTGSRSHLQNKALDSYAKDYANGITAGATLGFMGNSGYTMSSKFPGQAIRHGLLPDGTSAGAAGTHVDEQMFLNTQEGIQRVNPAFAPQYYDSLDDIRGGGAKGGFNLNLGGITIQIEGGATPEETADEAASALLRNPEFKKALIASMVKDGTFGSAMNSVGKHRARKGTA